MIASGDGFGHCAEMHRDVCGLRDHAPVGIEERASIAQSTCDNAADTAAVNACYAASQTARDSRIALTGTFGAGLNMYFTEFMGLSVEWRGLPFKMNESGTDERGAGGSFPEIGPGRGLDRIGCGRRRGARGRGVLGERGAREGGDDDDGEGFIHERNSSV